MEKGKKYHRGNLYEDLIKDAIVCIKKNGVETISIRTLAKNLDVKSSSFYYHFQSKEIFLKTVAIEAANQMTAKIKVKQKQIFNKGAAGAIERFRMLGEAYITFFYENPNLFRFVMYHSYLSGSELRELSLYTLLRESVAELRSFRVLNQNIKNVEDFIWSITHGIAEMCTSKMISIQDAYLLLANIKNFFNEDSFS